MRSAIEIKPRGRGCTTKLEFINSVSFKYFIHTFKKTFHFFEISLLQALLYIYSYIDVA